MVSPSSVSLFGVRWPWPSLLPWELCLERPFDPIHQSYQHVPCLALGPIPRRARHRQRLAHAKQRAERPARHFGKSAIDGIARMIPFTMQRLGVVTEPESGDGYGAKSDDHRRSLRMGFTPHSDGTPVSLNELQSFRHHENNLPLDHKNDTIADLPYPLEPFLRNRSISCLVRTHNSEPSQKPTPVPTLNRSSSPTSLLPGPR